MNRTEVLTRSSQVPWDELFPGVRIQVLASGSLGARGLTTVLARILPGAKLHYHTHPFSEAIVVLEGQATVHVEGRRYQLGPYDTMHLPAGTPHMILNASEEKPVLLHASFAADHPARDLIADTFPLSDRDKPEAGCPEGLVRFGETPIYELAPQAFFRDLFARRLGSCGICGGYGLFEPGAFLPCHYHGFDESITIIAGNAICQVAGQEYELANCDTACIPQGRPHRFLNRSDQPMAMIWVYAGDEPDRTLVATSFCEGRQGVTDQ